MKRNALFLFSTLLLSLLNYRADAACVLIENQELIEYSCEGGLAEDLNKIPSNAEKIRISHMPLNRISEELFSRFAGNLVVLTCSYCQISVIDENAFNRLQSLQQLSLDNNRLTEVKSAWFSGLRDLTYLDLNYNEIERIDGDVFRSSPELVDLRISGNQLQCLDLESMSALKDLKRIFINENPSFGCPNAVKRFLSNRNIDFEVDTRWDNITKDRVSTNEPLPPVPPSEFGIPDSLSSISSPPPQVPRTRWPVSEEPATYPPKSEPLTSTSTTTTTTTTTSTTTTTTTTETPTPHRRPYVPEMIQPSMPDQDFAYQGPYYDPKVTQQPFDNFRNTAIVPVSNATEEEMKKPVAIETVTRPTVLAAGVNNDQREPTTTECPNAVGLSRDSSLVAVFAMSATILYVSRWTSIAF